MEGNKTQTFQMGARANLPSYKESPAGWYTAECPVAYEAASKRHQQHLFEMKP